MARAKPEPKYSPVDHAEALAYCSAIYAHQANTGQMVRRQRNAGGVASGLAKARAEVQQAGYRWEDNDTADMVAWALQGLTREQRFQAQGLMDMARWTGPAPWQSLRNAWLAGTGQQRGKAQPTRPSVPLVAADPYAESGDD